LYDEARAYELDDVYTLIERDGAFHFVVDAPSEAEVAAGKSGDPFLYLYRNPPAALRSALATQRQVFAEYADEYGEFRSVFVPFRTPRGRTYVLGADVLLTDVENRLLRGLLPPLAMGIVCWRFR